MRLKTILARSMPEGMRRVREQLGEDAVIVSSEETDGGVMIMAAIDPESTPAPLPPPSLPAAVTRGEKPALDIAGIIGELLDRHRAPATVCAVLHSAAETWGGNEPRAALAGALAVRFGFDPIDTGPASRPLLLVGPPGAGKTVTVAKLAAAAVLGGQSPAVVCADTERAGGAGQLAAFTGALRLDLLRAATAADLGDTVAALGRRGPILIDGPALDPAGHAEARQLQALVAAADAEPLLVLPAGIDAAEAGDLAELWRSQGLRRFVATRLDAARRLGGILAPAANGLAFAAFGVSRQIGGGLRAASPETLADALLNETTTRTASTDPRDPKQATR